MLIFSTCTNMGKSDGLVVIFVGTLPAISMQSCLGTVLDTGNYEVFGNGIAKKMMWIAQKFGVLLCDTK